MKAALRVLTALSERHEPDQSDVDELHWYAPADRQRPLDELVCDAIQRALKDREQSRKAVQVRLRERALGLTPAPPQEKRDEARPEITRLVREQNQRRQEYLALNAKLQRIGTALQQAAAHMVATDSNAADSQAARDSIQPLAPDVDLSALAHLLNEHIRLTRQMLLGQQALKEQDIER